MRMYFCAFGYSTTIYHATKIARKGAAVFPGSAVCRNIFAQRANERGKDGTRFAAFLKIPRRRQKYPRGMERKSTVCWRGRKSKKTKNRNVVSRPVLS